MTLLLNRITRDFIPYLVNLIDGGIVRITLNGRHEHLTMFEYVSIFPDFRRNERCFLGR